MKNVLSRIRSLQAEGLRGDVGTGFGVVGGDDVVHVAVVACTDGYRVTLVVGERNVEVGIRL